MWAGVMLTAYLKTPQNTLDTMTKSVKTSHGQTLKSHGGVPNRRGCFGRQSGQKKKKKKIQEKKSPVWKIFTNVITTGNKENQNQNQKQKQKKNHFKRRLDYKNTFRISLKYLKMYSIRVFFLFFFLQSHASTFIFIIIITLIWIIIWMIYRTVIIIVI